MKSTRMVLLLTALILALLCLMVPCLSLETGILMTVENNLSIDLGPDYLLASKEISQTSNGVSFQTIAINNSRDGNATNATILIYSLQLYEEELSTINMSEFSRFMENTMVGALQLTGGKVAEEITVKNHLEKNVTLYSIMEPESKLKQNREEYGFAAWPIDSWNLIMLLSKLNETDNAKIIETLEVKS